MKSCSNLLIAPLFPAPVFLLLLYVLSLLWLCLCWPCEVTFCIELQRQLLPSDMQPARVTNHLIPTYQRTGLVQTPRKISHHVAKTFKCHRRESLIGMSMEAKTLLALSGWLRLLRQWITVKNRRLCPQKRAAAKSRVSIEIAPSTCDDILS
jgi:hypothetical protein